MKIKRRIIAFVVVVIALVIIDTNETDVIPDETAIPNISTLDFVPYDSEDTIVIPAVSGLNFDAGKTTQQVDFYNPAENSCYFKIELRLSNGIELWQSDYIEPNERISEIEISLPLKRGLYKNCLLAYKCYSLNDKSVLNSGTINIEINSK
jgi:hypothetical protein